MLNKNFWQGKKVLITGHTGFKGSWLSIMLIELGAIVVGYGLNPYSEKENFSLCKLENKVIDFRNDIRDGNLLKDIVKKEKPDVIFHLAAQPLVKVSYENPVETYEVNVNGTINLLESLRELNKKVTAILVTTDKCYLNKEQFFGYRETDSLGGYDPYSSSKACCEILIESYRNSFFNTKDYHKHKKGIASVRAGNVIGGGDWAKDRILPDIIRAIENKEKIVLRSPTSVRPWQHVLEPLRGYIMLAEKLHEDINFSGSWNFGPEIDSLVTVEEISKRVLDFYGEKSLLQTTKNNIHETKLLLLDITKAKLKLGWKPKLTVEDTVKLTVDWYKRYEKEDCYLLEVEEIKSYLAI
ncbi:MAG: CDP-glucose 4,6-dehydratase [Sarcina sp.]